MRSRRVRLGPGLRVSDRSDDVLQVGLHPGHRLVLPDDPVTRGLLDRLHHGLDPDRVPAPQRGRLRLLDAAGLLVPAVPAPARSPSRAGATVVVDTPEDDRAVVGRLLAGVGLTGSRSDAAAPVLVLRIGCEPRRSELDALAQTDRSHLLVTALAGRVRVGPTVVPGVTACQRCLDEHDTDVDPRHPLVLQQHLDPDLTDRPDPVDLQLALAWAVRDLVALVEGRRPTTWSATLDLTDEGPLLRPWHRHPRCGCAWDEALSGSA